MTMKTSRKYVHEDERRGSDGDDGEVEMFVTS